MSKKTFQVDAADSPVALMDVFRALWMKAREYVDAVVLDTGLQVSKEELLNLELALMQDFIEVHNAAIQHHIRIPESTAEVKALLAQI